MASEGAGTRTGRVMVDIETLGLEPGSAILSIGAVEFDSHGPKDSFYQSIDLVSCQEAGLEIDADTLDWWLHQGEEAKEQLTGGEDLAAVLSDFRDWYVRHGFDEVWANSPSFDCEHLETAYAAVGQSEPWHFKDERDFRTVTSLPVDVDIKHDGVGHDALDDAVYQSRVVAATLDQLEGQEVTPGDE